MCINESEGHSTNASSAKILTPSDRTSPHINIVPDTASFQSASTKPQILEENKIVCTICAEPISNYIPKLFLGEEINSACDDCQDSSTDSEVDTENYA